MKMDFKGIAGPIVGATLGAVFGFIIGNANKLIIDPVIELKKIISECLYVLTFRANFLCNPVYSTMDEYCRKENEGKLDKDRLVEYEKTAVDLRMASSRLKIATNCVVWFNVFSLLRIIPPKKDLHKVADILMGLSNSTPIGKCEENVNRRNKCYELLGASVPN
jgi:hypothetical protein